MATTQSSENHRLFADFIKLVLSTDELQQMTKGVSAELLQSWSSESWVKKRIAKRVEKKLQNNLQSQDKDFQTEVFSFLEEHNLIPVILKQLPLGFNGVIDLSQALLQNLDTLSAEEKTELLGAIFDKTTLFKSGQLLTGIAKFINEIHGESPTFFTEKMTPHFSQWLEHTDFGEFREALENSEEDFIALMAAANDVFSESPAKMVCLYSCLPILMNICVAGLSHSLTVQNTMAPEMLADIICSLIKDIKPETIALLLNESNELSRKILTGSALLSDSGDSKLSTVLAGKTAAVYKELDFGLMVKAGDMLTKTKEQYTDALVEAAKRHPEQATAYFRRLIKPVIEAPHAWNRNMAIVEELLTDDQIAEEVAKGISDIDVQELAETANRFLAMVNSISPLLAAKGIDPMDQFVASLDPFEVSETFKMVTDNAVKSLKPIAHDIMPHLVRGVTELLRPETDRRNTELETALAEFRSVLFAEETN
jgi:hypothetical protein